MSDTAQESVLALANYLSGRTTLFCAKCRLHRHLTLTNHGLKIRLPDPNIPTDLPRIDMWCTYCSTIMGRILATPDASTDTPVPDGDRWQHLELDETNDD